MKNKKIVDAAFTLVELLVVMTIIVILASISFKAASVMNERAAVARTSERLAQISACLAEYYAEFGQYPGAERVEYTEWNEGTKPSDWEAKVKEKRQSDEDFASDDDDGLLYYFRNVMNENSWKKFKDNVGLDSWVVGSTEFISGDVAFSNKFYTLRDGWGQYFNYKCYEPYTSYKLYSDGATSSKADDIYAGQKY